MGRTLNKQSVRAKVQGMMGENPAFLCEVGSTVHGIGVGEQDDFDLTALRVESWTELICGNIRNQSKMYRTADKGARSGPGDYDLNVYTVRKFAQLCVTSNPSILNLLFVPEDAIFTNNIGSLRRDLKGVVVSKDAAGRFLGYMTAQMERWRGERGQKNVNRPELVEAYGFDTKYAAHIIRLGFQGAHFLRTGIIPIPLPEGVASAIRDLRTGQFTEEDALSWAEMVRNDLRDAETESPLPPKPSRQGVERILHDFYAARFQIGAE